MFNFDYITKEDIKEHNQNWPETPDHLHRILILEGSGPDKTNWLLNLIIMNQILIQLLLNTWIIWMIFIKILKITI